MNLKRLLALMGICSFLTTPALADDFGRIEKEYKAGQKMDIYRYQVTTPHDCSFFSFKDHLKDDGFFACSNENGNHRWSFEGAYYELTVDQAVNRAKYKFNEANKKSYTILGLTEKNIDIDGHKGVLLVLKTVTYYKDDPTKKPKYAIDYFPKVSIAPAKPIPGYNSLAYQCTYEQDSPIDEAMVEKTCMAFINSLKFKK